MPLDSAEQLLQYLDAGKKIYDSFPKHEVKTWSDYLPKLKWEDKQKGGRKRKPTSRRVRSKSSGASISLDGRTTRTASFKKRKTGRGRKKESTRSIVKKLKKNLPKKSYKHKIDYQCLVMPTNKNSRTVFEIPMVNTGIVEALIDQLAATDSAATVNYTSENSSVKIDWFYKLICKNNGTANAKIRFAFFKCIDDDNEGILTNVIEGLGNRGYTGLPSVASAVAATATASRYPVRVAFGSVTPFHTPLFGIGEVKRKWKQLGKVQGAVIGPGASFNVVKSGNFTYKPEILDDEPFTHTKNYDYQVIIEVTGDLCHDQTNDKLVGMCGAQLDSEEQSKVTATYFNPKGLNQVEYSDTLTDTNFVTPVFADTVASVISTFTT